MVLLESGADVTAQSKVSTWNEWKKKLKTHKRGEEPTNPLKHAALESMYPFGGLQKLLKSTLPAKLHTPSFVLQLPALGK